MRRLIVIALLFVATGCRQQVLSGLSMEEQALRLCGAGNAACISGVRILWTKIQDVAARRGTERISEAALWPSWMQTRLHDESVDACFSEMHALPEQMACIHGVRLLEGFIGVQLERFGEE